jgi:hypothetical protein
MGRWYALFLLLLLLPAGYALNDEQRLATLATNMLATTSGDYALECGPVADADHKPDILNQLPLGTAYGDYYCVLTQNNKVVFGTFGDPQKILQSFKDPAFDRQQFTIDAIACNGLPPADEFQECPGAITGQHRLYVYSYNAQPNDDTTYIIVSENSVSGFNQRGFLGQFFDWLTKFFSTPETFLTTEEAFHHAYYAHQNGKNVTAVWHDTAFIIYQNFGTDFNVTRPANSKYSLGRNQRQALELTLSKGNTQDVAMWHKYTSGLRIAAGGTPISGNACGDSVRSFDEECEPGLAAPACSAVFTGQYQSGNLKCFARGTPNECQWDTSACVSCQDVDEDGYSSAKGVTDILTFATSVTIITNTSKRVLPIPYDLAFNAAGEQSFRTALSAADARIAAEGEDAVYSNDATFVTPRGIMMQTLLNTHVAARPCIAKQCPDGYWPIAEGIKSNYSLLLPQLKAQGSSAVFRITLGGCTDGSCGQYGYGADSQYRVTSGLATKVTYTDAELRKTRAYCNMIASGIDAYWTGLPGNGARPTEYIIVGDPAEANIRADSYDALYRKCKQGITDALGTGATAVYGIPAASTDNNLQQYAYTQGIFQNRDAYDAVYMEAKMVNGKYEELTLNEMKVRGDKLATLKLPIYLRSSAGAAEQTFYGARLPLSMSIAGMSVLIYDTTNGNISGNGTHTWNATAKALSGVVYRFTRLPNGALPAGVEAFLTDNGKTSITFFNLGAQQTVTLDLSSCQLQNVRRVGKNLVETKPSFDGVLKPYSITTLELGGAPNCIAPIGENTACNVLVDCNDTNPDVYPSKTEICGDAVDNNCNAQIDESGCDASLNPPPTVICDYDGICEEGETAQCRDCGQYANSCPTNWTFYKSQGAYKIYTRAGERNNPELLITIASPSQDCYTGQGGNGPVFMNATSSSKMVYYNGGAQSMRIIASAQGTKWVINGEESTSGSGAGQTCWACADEKCATLNLEIPFTTTGCDLSAQCAPLGGRWYTPEDCCNCLSPDGSGLCKNDALGCFGKPVSNTLDHPDREYDVEKFNYIEP